VGRREETVETWETYQAVLQVQRIEGAQRKTLQKEIVVSWVQGLARWDAWATFTFQTQEALDGHLWLPSADLAERIFLGWHKRLQRGRGAFYVVEQHPGGHGPHLHALLASQGAWRRSLWLSWFNRWGRARVESIHRKGGVAGYCAKHLLGYEMTKQFNRGIPWGVLNCNRGVDLRVTFKAEGSLARPVDSADDVLHSGGDNRRFKSLASA
jgi:hypothetical protein